MLARRRPWRLNTLTMPTRLLLALAVLALLGPWAARADTAAPRARQVILFIADGASWGTWDIASYWTHGRKGQQPYDRFAVKLGMLTVPLNTANTPTLNDTATVRYEPARAWRITPDAAPDAAPVRDRPGPFDGYYYLKRDYTDSAAAATALASGAKTYNNAINHDNFGRPLAYITQHAKAQGLATGVVSSVAFSHATPAAFGAQNASRHHYGEISRQMVDNPALDLIMGTGHPLVDNRGAPRATPRFASDIGAGGGYVAEGAWRTVTDPASGWQLVETAADFEALAQGRLPITGRRLIGLPRVHDTLQFARDAAQAGRDAANPSGIAFTPGVPTLETMTRGALRHLGRQPGGFFLMVEGGAIDWAAHANDTARLIEEMGDFNQAVQAAVDWVTRHSDWQQALVVVLTDHGNGLPMGPDSDRLAFEPVRNHGRGVLPGVRWHHGSHSNENTLLFAHGAGAERFFEQVVAIDPGLVHIARHNDDGRTVDNTAVYRVLRAVMGPAQ
jgi:alkaline phosphatase